ncbi:septal ring lytic transglycosylase RlpA family protein [Rubrivirga sp. S365]|uniref:Probable endolytic peptidoglycan transglycosylase RlpA n=1 Tax=Rubrivirga litoralis TaxID=3075598 RepID=A0ABU3BPB3_9BACT|nr:MULTISPECIES: septal ring lytic transglycosylase RlpA family protein [unclassified Rubrivirga]MDT0631117.1 septal ring lytic transglycosylase RlpA family protein [Rubrivirga sp. F394]MDT7855370.1 septal ring lytic transglycosylase RlpA family protein [Rubrivirga sp. S365]
MQTVSPTPALSTPPRRLRRLRSRLRTPRRRTRAATGLAVLATAIAFRPQPAPEPAAPRAEHAAAPSAAPPAREAPAVSHVEGGEASYYGDELAGNPTASGEPFEPDALTAAHRSLPLGSRLRVTNVHTNESVVVRVNDRGPYAEDRVLDLSEAAAREIGMVKRGTADVRLELLSSRRAVRG